MTPRALSHLLIAALIVLAVTPPAHARRRSLVLITHGENMKELAEVPADAPVKQKYADAKVGYRYNGFGVFWLNIWTWGGEFCVYSDEQSNYIPGTPEEIAAMASVPVDAIKKPITYSLPPGLLVLVGIIGAIVASKVLKARGGGGD